MLCLVKSMKPRAGSMMPGQVFSMLFTVFTVMLQRLQNFVKFKVLQSFETEQGSETSTQHFVAPKYTLFANFEAGIGDFEP